MNCRTYIFIGVLVFSLMGCQVKDEFPGQESIPKLDHFNQLGVVHNELVEEMLRADAEFYADGKSHSLCELEAYNTRVGQDYIKKYYHLRVPTLSAWYIHHTMRLLSRAMETDESWIVLQKLSKQSTLDYNPQQELEQLQKESYASFTEDGRLTDAERQFLNAVSVAVYSNQLWRTGKMDANLENMYGLQIDRKASVKWWWADAAGAAVGLVSFWPSTVITAAVASVSATAIQSATIEKGSKK